MNKRFKTAAAALGLALAGTAVIPATTTIGAEPAEAYVDYYESTYVCKYWSAPGAYVLQLQRWKVRDYNMLEELFGNHDSRTLIGTQWTSTRCRLI